MNEAREVKLTNRDLTIILEAMNEHYLKTIRKFQRTKQPRTKGQTAQLATQQQLIQYLGRIRYEWTMEPEAETPSSV